MSRIGRGIENRICWFSCPNFQGDLRRPFANALICNLNVLIKLEKLCMHCYTLDPVRGSVIERGLA